MSPSNLKWTLCESRHCRNAELHANSPDASWFAQKLSQAKTDNREMTKLRAVLTRLTGQQLFRMADQDVIAGVAELLAGRKLFLHDDSRSFPDSISTVGGEVSAVPFPIAERRPRPPSAPSRVAADEPATFPRDINFRVQASVLASAAASGTPFCPL